MNVASANKIICLKSDSNTEPIEQNASEQKLLQIEKEATSFSVISSLMQYKLYSQNAVCNTRSRFLLIKRPRLLYR